MIRFRQIFGLAVACLLFLAACSETPANNQPGPTSPPSTGDALNVAKSFLDYWVAEDYKSMYGLLSPKGQETALDTFTKYYQETESTLKLAEKGKSYAIKGQPDRQGTTVAVHYDMTFDSGPLGKFTDANRVLRLILTKDRGWRVAWSTMDVFDGLAGGATLYMELNQSARGIIYDRNGKVIAQDSVPNVTVRLVTEKYPKKPQDCFYKLADTFRIRESDLETQYAPFTGLQYGFTIGHMSLDDWNAKQADLQSVCELNIQQQSTRFYYGGGLAPQTIGWVGPIPADQAQNYPQYAQGALVGRMGVEQYYQSQLAGQSGAKLVIRMPDGTEVRTIATRTPSPSQDVTLTIDRDLQLATEQAIAGAYNASNWAQFSTGAAAVVLDVNTGEVLAMASFPSVDPDAYLTTTAFDLDHKTGGVLILQDYDKTRALNNRAVGETYAAGSVFKIVTTAAAADSKTFKLSDIYTCNGQWDGRPYSDVLRNDWIFLDKYVEQRYHGPITLQMALTSSCDSYFWEVGKKFYDDQHNDLLSKYAHQMGLGVKSGIDVLDEQTGYIPDPDSKFAKTNVRWGLGDTLNTVIGQGDVQVTPIQVARMLMGVGNGGKLYTPYIVKSVSIPGQQATYTANPPTPTPMNIDPQVLSGVQEGLCEVTRLEKMPGTKKQEYGTAHYVFYNWNFDQVSVCGKTGTAQTGAREPNAWFAAYAGRVDPKTGTATAQIAIAVIVEHSREGSEVAAPIVRRIIENYYGIQPVEPWPYFWTGDYDPMVDPGASDGGGPRTR